MIKNSEILQSLHLSPDELGVYLAALEYGPLTVQGLADRSKVKRTTIYTFLDRLVERGVLEKSRKRKRELYHGVNPHRLYEMEQARLKEFARALPELEAISKHGRPGPRVTYYEGLDGIKEIYADILHERKPIVGWSDFENNLKVMGDFYAAYVPERSRRNITYRAIVKDTPMTREWTKRNIGALRETKFAKSDDIQNEVTIYGDKMAVMNFRSRPALAILIEDAQTATTLRFAWQQLWDRLP
ncbi:MAG: helix-turn-helix domain-containing protein [Patescibacteria group bacterium]